VGLKERAVGLSACLVVVPIVLQLVVRIVVESYGRTIMIFRRPELEKDNPIAPEPYVGPRRRLAMARAVAAGQSAEAGDVMETLQVLTKAAARVLKRLSYRQNTDGDVETLRAAIARAEQTLSVQEYPLSPSKLKV